MAANSDSEQTARQAQAGRGWGRFWRYLMLVLFLIAVISFIYARAVGKAARELNAENKAKIEWITGYLARTAGDDAGRARSAILRQNMGSAQDALRRAEATIDAMEHVALKSERAGVTTSRRALERAREALRKGKNSDAEKAIDDLIRALGPLTAE